MADSFALRARSKCRQRHGDIDTDRPCFGCIDDLAEEERGKLLGKIEYGDAYRAFYFGLSGQAFPVTSDRKMDYVEAGIELRLTIEAGAQKERLLEIIDAAPSELTRRRAARRDNEEGTERFGTFTPAQESAYCHCACHGLGSKTCCASCTS